MSIIRQLYEFDMLEAYIIKNSRSLLDNGSFCLFNITRFDYASALNTLAASTIASNAALVSGQARVFKPQSGFTQS